MSSVHDTGDRTTEAVYPASKRFVWTRRFGYVRVRDLVRGGALLYVFLISLVTVMTSDPFTLVFLGVLAVVALRFVSLEGYVSPRRRVTLYTEGGLFVAEHLGTGANRHGETPEDALASLDGVLERRRAERTSA